MPFATGHSEKQDFEPMCGTRGETVYFNNAGWGTCRNKRKMETQILFHQVEQKKIQESHLTLETIE